MQRHQLAWIFALNTLPTIIATNGASSHTRNVEKSITTVSSVDRFSIQTNNVARASHRCLQIFCSGLPFRFLRYPLHFTVRKRETFACSNILRSSWLRRWQWYLLPVPLFFVAPLPWLSRSTSSICGRNTFAFISSSFVFAAKYLSSICHQLIAISPWTAWDGCWRTNVSLAHDVALIMLEVIALSSELAWWFWRWVY